MYFCILFFFSTMKIISSFKFEKTVIKFINGQLRVLYECHSRSVKAGESKEKTSLLLILFVIKSCLKSHNKEEFQCLAYFFYRSKLPHADPLTGYIFLILLFLQAIKNIGACTKI